MRQQPNKEHVALANRLRARGAAALSQGSASANAAAAGAAPGAGEGPKPKFHPLAVLKGMETGKLLGGKELNQAARALTALEIRPQLHGYKQLANQLTKERNEEATGLGKLGTELQGNVGSVYGNIAGADATGNAAQAAIAAQLNQQSGAIAKQGADSLASMQNGAVGDLNAGLALRGAPTGGSAQQQLSDAVAQQGQAQAADAGAAQQFAASQGAGNQALAAQLAGATQMQGGAAVSGIGHDVVGRVGESNQKYGESIQTALGKLADVKATKGATFNKNLLGLRGEEQKFLLGKQAVAGEKAKLGLEGEKLTEQEKQDAAANQINQEKAAASLTSAAASAKQAAIAGWEAKHPNASSGETAAKRKEAREGVQEIKSLIGPTVAELGKVPGNIPPNKVLNIYIAKVNSKASANPTLVAKVMKEWFRNKGIKVSKDPNGASLGR